MLHPVQERDDLCGVRFADGCRDLRNRERLGRHNDAGTARDVTSRLGPRGPVAEELTADGQAVLVDRPCRLRSRYGHDIDTRPLE